MDLAQVSPHPSFYVILRVHECSHKCLVLVVLDIELQLQDMRIGLLHFDILACKTGLYDIKRLLCPQFPFLVFIKLPASFYQFLLQLLLSFLKSLLLVLCLCQSLHVLLILLSQLL